MKNTTASKTKYMKTTLSLIMLFSFSIQPIPNVQGNYGPDEVLIGVYQGLTEKVEFRFTDLNGKDFLFDELAENLGYDLIDQKYVGQKFKVYWQKRSIPVLREEDRTSEQTEEIRVIVGLEKL
jgi:hypothetical protein